MNKKYIIFIGPPGSGKGTISDYLVKNLNFFHLSTGKIFRHEIETKGLLSKKINSYLEEGELVPDEVTNQLVQTKLSQVTIDDKNIILDGYPRNIDQAKFLESIFKVSKVFYIDVDDELIIKRIIGRLNCPKCNTIYNEYFMPPKIKDKCDKDGVQLVKREDDNIETIKNRLKIYHDQTFPLFDFYKEKNILEKISGNENLNIIINQIIQSLKSI